MIQMRRNKEPKRRSVEMEINVDGKTKRLVATNCVIKSSLFSRLGFGKKREVLACQSLDIMDDGRREDVEDVEEDLETEDGYEQDDGEPEGMIAGPAERAKATPKPVKERKEGKPV